ncbi:hypothetical protein [Hyphomicrobium sp.]|uniref:hypothetical protein n=1 Tax=Hyphomicrobium sp. TaxID=82 RepID=UPI001E1970AD|nr:hypothetical protein [Hyphomicrobium sp.]MBY0562441.1 hypothetical protein [Hyphomicrobium sp.]
MAILSKVAKYAAHMAKSDGARFGAKLAGIKAAKFGAKAAIVSYAAREEYKRAHNLPDASPTMIPDVSKYDTPRAILGAGGFLTSVAGAGLEGIGLAAKVLGKRSKAAAVVGKVLTNHAAHRAINTAILGGFAVGVPNYDAVGRVAERHFDKPDGWKPGAGSNLVKHMIEGHYGGRDLMAEAESRAKPGRRSPSQFGTPRKQRQGPVTKADLKNGWWVQKANGTKYWRRANDR